VSIEESTEKMEAKKKSAALMLAEIERDKLPNPRFVFGAFMRVGKG